MPVPYRPDMVGTAFAAVADSAALTPDTLVIVATRTAGAPEVPPAPSTATNFPTSACDQLTVRVNVEVPAEIDPSLNDTLFPMAPNPASLTLIAVRRAGTPAAPLNATTP